MRARALLPFLVAIGCVGGRGPIPTDMNASALDMTSSVDLASTSPASGCGQQLGNPPVTFCETFDAPASVGDRGGEIDSNVWGVARVFGGGTNLGQDWYDLWSSTLLVDCDGTTPRVSPPNDVIICNGQLREAANDNGAVTSLAMYAKQPFDFAGRTGTVSFDVSNDAGAPGAWPELWISDAPVPDAFSFNDGWQSLPPNGLAVRFDSATLRGSQGECPTSNDLAQIRFSVDSAAVVRNFVLDDTRGFGPGTIQLKLDDCAVESTGPGQMNRIEVRISTSQIDVYATNAGVVPTPATLKHLAVITGANLTFTRGFVELVDVHNNGNGIDASRMSQQEHTFAWDNVAFDGPFTYRDFSYEAPDNNVAGSNGATNLGQLSTPTQASKWSVPGLPASLKGTASVTFNLDTGGGANPTVLNVLVNGHAHSVPWPYSDASMATRTLAATVPLTDLLAGTNTLQLNADQNMVFSNVDIVLGDVPGGVAVLPGANRAYPK